METNKAKIERLTPREEEIMNYFWEVGPMFVKDILESHPKPKPHINTLSTIVRTIEDKGLLSHHSFGKTYQYYPIVTRDEYNKACLYGVVDRYFNQSPLSVISTLVNEETVDIDDLKELIKRVENQE